MAYSGRLVHSGAIIIHRSRIRIYDLYEIFNLSDSMCSRMGVFREKIINDKVSNLIIIGIT